MGCWWNAAHKERRWLKEGKASIATDLASPYPACPGRPSSDPDKQKTPQALPFNQSLSSSSSSIIIIIIIVPASSVPGLASACPQCTGPEPQSKSCCKSLQSHFRQGWWQYDGLYLKILLFLLFPDTFPIQGFFLFFFLFLDTLCIQKILLFSCFQILSAFKRFYCFSLSCGSAGQRPAWA